jgi:glycerophosphoryl diester phosphodiesterase/HEAT repeat protein
VQAFQFRTPKAPKIIRMTASLCVFLTSAAFASSALPNKVKLLCHRTANEDVPENTLESLEEAALLGCNIVELDLRRTLDGKIVVNHDGVLERLTDGVGTVEGSYYDDLKLRDVGGWMGERFTGMRMPLFEEMLRSAREHDLRLVLDIKTGDMGPEVLKMLRREGMLERVQFGGEWDEIKKLYPGAKGTDDSAVWVQPGVTAEQVKTYHRAGKAVIVNFSVNDHELDLGLMKAAVAAGADAINTDFPRLGADAVGRPVERKLSALIAQAGTGSSQARFSAILELSRYRGFSLEPYFASWLLDSDDHVSRAAAVALATARPRTQASVFAVALRSQNSHARANAAWALGALSAQAATLVPLLDDDNPQVLQETLIALGHMPGGVGAEKLLPLFTHKEPEVRAAAAFALASHQPEVAVTAVPAQLRVEMASVMKLWEHYVERGKPKLTEAESEEITGFYRCQVKMVQAISMLRGVDAMQALEEQAFRPGKDFSWSNSTMAAFQLWDRIGQDARSAVQALGAGDIQVADRAEWLLVQGGKEVLPEVRKALGSGDPAVRRRAIRILAWQGDRGSLDMLRVMQKLDSTNAHLATWAIDKIESLLAK